MFQSIVPSESTDLNLKRDLYLIFKSNVLDCIKKRCFFHSIHELKELKNQEKKYLSLPKLRKNSRSFRF